MKKKNNKIATGRNWYANKVILHLWRYMVINKFSFFFCCFIQWQRPPIIITFYFLFFFLCIFPFYFFSFLFFWWKNIAFYLSTDSHINFRFQTTIEYDSIKHMFNIETNRPVQNVHNNWIEAHKFYRLFFLFFCCCVVAVT